MDGVVIRAAPVGREVCERDTRRGSSSSS
uniref:Uncharacterized protein n=1 Tax=Arundo donax TaxID=35708 RepID=A0A0A8YGY8_ARUDO